MLFADSNGGGAEEDVLFGGADSDILVSGSGRDHFNGGSGHRRRELAGIGLRRRREPRHRPRHERRGRGHLHARREPDRQPLRRHSARKWGQERPLRRRRRGQAVRPGRERRAFGRRRQRHARWRRGLQHPQGRLGRRHRRLQSAQGSSTSTSRTASFSPSTATTPSRRSRWFAAQASHDSMIGDGFGNRSSGMAATMRSTAARATTLLTGGTGADIFVFVASSRGRFSPATDSGFDVITDFNRSAGDQIDLSRHKEATDFATLRAEASQFGDRHPAPSGRRHDRPRRCRAERAFRRHVRVLTVLIGRAGSFPARPMRAVPPHAPVRHRVPKAPPARDCRNRRFPS